MNRLFKKLMLASVVAAFSINPVLAENRALLIGVGSYKDPKHNLPGIDLDVAMMKDAALLMGYKEKQIKTLMDSQATTANVRKAINDWLIKGVKPGENALIYYSGHGSQIPDKNNDEKDRSDEVLTMHELDVLKPSSGKPTLKGVLVDDELNDLLNKIKTDNLLVMVDACHSGTSTKSFNFNSRSAGVPFGVEKFIRYEGMPISTDSQFDFTQSASGNKFANTRSVAGKKKNSFVAIAAARDDEKSLATSRGSLFTLGVKRAIADAASKKRPLTASQLVKTVDGFIGKAVKDKNRRFHPQLTGSGDKLIQVVSASKVKVNRQNVIKLIDSAEVSGMRFSSNRKKFKIGDKLELEIDIPIDGFMNVVVIDADDVATVLFPNKFHPDNNVTRGKMSLVRDSNSKIPAGKRKYSLPANKPFGDTLLAVYVTSNPVNWFKDGDGEWDDLGKMKNAFAGLATKSTLLSRGGFSAVEEVQETVRDKKFGAYKSVNIVR